VTIFLHRHQAHRALDLNPVVSHFFRFWLWLTTGMITREFVAVHRKHHAKCETVDDPHSPQTRGLKKLLLEGTELYRAESKNMETMAKYGYGTPDEMLDDAEQKDERAEQHRLEQNRDDQCSILEPSAETERPANENDLGNDERFEEGDPVVDIDDAEFGKDQAAIGRERTEKQEEVKDDDPVRLEFRDGPLLEAGVLVDPVFHGFPRDWFPARADAGTARLAANCCSSAFLIRTLTPRPLAGMFQPLRLRSAAGLCSAGD